MFELQQYIGSRLYIYISYRNRRHSTSVIYNGIFITRLYLLFILTIRNIRDRTQRFISDFSFSYRILILIRECYYRSKFIWHVFSFLCYMNCERNILFLGRLFDCSTHRDNSSRSAVLPPWFNQFVIKWWFIYWFKKW